MSSSPLIKPKGIDDVPIVTLTLFSRNPAISAFDLERVAHSIESDLKRVAGTREVNTIGGPGRAVVVEIDPARMASTGVTVPDLRTALQSANLGLPVGELLVANRAVAVESGPFLKDARDVAELVVGVRDGKPIFLRNVATVRDGPLPASRYVWHGVAGKDGGEYPAVTIAITKKPGENAIDVANAVMRRVEMLRNTVIPHDIEVAETRNYGATANDKAQKLIQKLLFATASVVALVFLALGRREAAIVGSAVILTLAATLFASWAWGFTLNRVSLFALIFSIGILVDDAIVVVENIHRHQQLYPGQAARGNHSRRGRRSRRPHHPGDADGDRGAAADGLRLRPDGAVHESHPDQREHGHADVAGDCLRRHAVAVAAVAQGAACGVAKARNRMASRASSLQSSTASFGRCSTTPAASATACCWGSGVAALIAVSLVLPAVGLVQLKMLPFDNKSEFQVVVDMPAGTPVEQTAAVLHELGHYLATVPEVTDYQAYAGTAAPINFNGLVRQYYLRAGGEVGDIQVNLVDKHHRSEQSHAIATRVRPASAEDRSPLQREREGRRSAAGSARCRRPSSRRSTARRRKAAATSPKRCARVFDKTAGVVDVDDSSIAAAPEDAPAGRPAQGRDARRAAGSHRQHLASRAGRRGHELPPRRNQISRRGDAAAARRAARRPRYAAATRRAFGARASWSRFASWSPCSDSLREQPIYHKDLLPVNYVVADMAGRVDSPLYGMFAMRGDVRGIATSGRRVAGRVLHPSARRPLPRLLDQVGRRVANHLRDVPRHGRRLRGRPRADLSARGRPVRLVPHAADHHGTDPADHHRRDARSCAARRAVHGDQHDRHDRAGRDHRAQLDPAGGLHQHPGTRRRRVQGSSRPFRDHPRAADHADRPGCDARRLLHSRRPDLQRARHFADLRDLRLHPPHPRGHSHPVLRGLSQAPQPNLPRRTSMTSWQIVRLVAGTFILLSLALGIPGSPLFVSQWWLAFTAFVGANLLQSALTRWCLMETIVRKLGAREGC